MASEQFILAAYMVVIFLLGVGIGAALITRKFQMFTLLFYSIGLALLGLGIGQFLVFSKPNITSDLDMFWALEIMLFVVGGFCFVLGLIHMKVRYIK